MRFSRELENFQPRRRLVIHKVGAWLHDHNTIVLLVTICIDLTPVLLKLGLTVGDHGLGVLFNWCVFNESLIAQWFNEVTGYRIIRKSHMPDARGGLDINAKP